MSRPAKIPLKPFGGINTLPCLFEALTDEKTVDFRPENGTKSRRRRSAFLYSIHRKEAMLYPRDEQKRKMEWAFSQHLTAFLLKQSFLFVRSYSSAFVSLRQGICRMSLNIDDMFLFFLKFTERVAKYPFKSPNIWEDFYGVPCVSLSSAYKSFSKRSNS